MWSQGNSVAAAPKFRPGKLSFPGLNLVRRLLFGERKDSKGLLF